jgi:hypothetical protein
MFLNFSLQEHKKIGVFLSGGMDSALLLYLLRQQFSNSIYPITVPKHDGAVNYIDGIISWVETAIDKKIEPPIILGNPDLHHDAILGHAIRKCLGHNMCDLYFVGDNIYPTDILPNGPNRVKYNHPRIIYPLFDLHKTDILKLYVEYNIMELLHFTHTCTEVSVGRCQTCWQCKERQWAFEQLSIIDPSNN